jgi:GT2 family glycosyltransferase
MGSAEKKTVVSTRSKRKRSRSAETKPFRRLEEGHGDEGLDWEEPPEEGQARAALAAVSTFLGDDRIQAALYDAKLTLAGLRQGQIEDEEDPEQDALAYLEGVRAIREAVREAVPPDATVVVASSGDEDLLDLYGREAWHFPRAADGEYAGTYPVDGTAVIAHLETLRARGGSYFLLPAPVARWRESYPKLIRHLDQRYPLVHDDQATCLIFQLRGIAQIDSAPRDMDLSELISDYRERMDLGPGILDWDTGVDLQELLPGGLVFSPPSREEALPYLDNSIPIVAVRAGDQSRLREAERVANYAVIEVPQETTALRGDSEGSAADLSIDVREVDDGKPSRHEPSTSIVIPAHDGSEQLEVCLAALQETLPVPFSGEVILVDDGSTDELQALLARWRRSPLALEMVRNNLNRDVAVSCNRGADAATGDILIFLDNDVLLQAGWLRSLLRIFRRDPDAGAVGGKVLRPDGTLEEAGSLIFSDGSVAGFGRGDHDVDAPIYSHVREADACSLALLATPRAIFAESGGFDEEYRPAYYADVDYCFGLRQRGYRVYYQPESVAVRTEASAAGTDLPRDVKRYQAVNQAKFVRKWGDALAQQPPRPLELDRRSWTALAVSP